MDKIPHGKKVEAGVPTNALLFADNTSLFSVFHNITLLLLVT